MEIDFLKFLEDDERVRGIIHRVHRAANLITRETGYSTRVPLLSIQEKSIIENYDKSFLEPDDTLLFSLNNTYFKFIVVDDTEIDKLNSSLKSCTYKQFSPINNNLSDNIIYLIRRNYLLEIPGQFITFIYLVASKMISDFAKAEYDIDVIMSTANVSKHDISQFRYSIDFMIIIFKIMDGIFDLKYSDFEYIRYIMDISPFEEAYRYAITKDTTIEDYENMVSKTLNEQLKTVDYSALLSNKPKVEADSITAPLSEEVFENE